MEVKVFDFSKIHYLDHMPFTRHCRSLHGGWRNHLSLAWEFEWKPRIAVRTSCRLGWHQWGMASQGDEEWEACWYCSKPRSPRT